MKKIIIAVITCEKFRHRANAQRASWVRDVKGAGVKFFLARQNRDPLPDEIFLDCGDDYASLPRKVQLMTNWVLAHGYDLVLKTDDDAYIFPDRLLGPEGAGPSQHIAESSYAGNFMAIDDGFCCGFGYFMDRKAMKIVAKGDPTGWLSEDRWVGHILYMAGIVATHIREFVLADRIPRYLCVHPETLVAAEFEPKEMMLVHSGSQPGGWQARKLRLDARRANRMIRGNGEPFV